jgi:hypothetical protein
MVQHSPKYPPALRTLGANVVKQSSLINLLRKIAAAPTGFSRREAANSVHYPVAKLNALRATDFPYGLQGLIVERQAAGKGNRCPRIVWFLTAKGRQLLKDLKTDSDATPVTVSGNRKWQPYTNYHFLSEQRRKRNQHKANQLKYDSRLSNPNFSGADYREPADDDLLQIEIGSAEFKTLSPLERIRILRTRSGRNQQGDFDVQSI